MTTVTLTESGITFGPYDVRDVFPIERSQIYQRLKVGVKVVEFLLIRNRPPGVRELLIVEAKSSTPKDPLRVREFSDEVRQKMTNSLLLWLGILHGRHEGAREELPEMLLNVPFESLAIRLILVINGHKEQWLPPLQDSLQKSLQAVCKTLNSSRVSVVVINEEGAKKIGLVS